MNHPSIGMKKALPLFFYDHAYVRIMLVCVCLCLRMKLNQCGFLFITPGYRVGHVVG